MTKRLDPCDNLPDLPLEAWEESKITLNLYAQIVGKVRLALHPPLNHWWHAPLYLSPRGLTTAAIPWGAESIAFEFDFFEHALVLRSSVAADKRLALYDGLTVATFYRAVMRFLDELGVAVRILPAPFDAPKVGSTLPFPEDETNGRYDASYVHRFWRVLCWSYGVFEEFKGGFYGKSSPVHLFWHSFDLAHTRFSGRRAPVREGADAVTREAYSHELISFGFWAGDAQVRAPTFYSYTYPEPKGIEQAPLEPAAASWRSADGSSMALVSYDDLRALPNPKAGLLAFLESSYRAGATRAGWDTGLERF